MTHLIENQTTPKYKSFKLNSYLPLITTNLLFVCIQVCLYQNYPISTRMRFHVTRLFFNAEVLICSLPDFRARVKPTDR